MQDVQLLLPDVIRNIFSSDPTCGLTAKVLGETGLLEVDVTECVGINLRDKVTGVR